MHKHAHYFMFLQTWDIDMKSPRQFIPHINYEILYLAIFQSYKDKTHWVYLHDAV